MNVAVSEIEELRERVALLEAALASGMGFVPAPDRSVGAIVKWTAFETGIAQTVITGPCRLQQYVRVRAAIAWGAHQLGYSSNRIARVLGDRHHTSILTSIGKGELLRQRDPAFVMLTDKLLAAFSRKDS